MIPIFPSTIRLFEEKQCGIERFDDVFHNCCELEKEGYFIFSGKDEKVYLFIVNGAPYASGRVEKGEGLLFLDVKEFFDTYLRISTGNLTFYKVEKKLLLSILIYFKKRPLQRFTANMVDMEKVLKDIEVKGADSLIVTRCGEKISFSMCLKGKPSFNYFPEGVYAKENPREAILLYIFNEKGCIPFIDIFDDIRISPAVDAILTKIEMPKSLTTHYTMPSAQASVNGAFLILMLEDKIISQYPIEKTETTIGRSAGSDMIIENPGVSRHHAIIKEKDGGFIIEDKGSTNGTFVNGERITTNRILKDGDQIQILRYILTYHIKIESFLVKAKKIWTAKLVLENGKEFLLKSTVITIGSSAEIDLRIEGRLIASHQASILRGKEGEFILLHKGGKTATKVNGEKIEKHLLKNGDVIEIGQHKISYVTE